MSETTHRGLALVGRKSGEIIIITPLSRGERYMIDVVNQIMGVDEHELDWERAAEGCKLVEVVVSIREQ